MDFDKYFYIIILYEKHCILGHIINKAYVKFVHISSLKFTDYLVRWSKEWNYTSINIPLPIYIKINNLNV